MRTEPAKNPLLAMLPREEFASVSSQLEDFVLSPRQQLQDCQAAATHVYFVEQGLISLMAPTGGGEEAEVGLIGPEGCLGAQLALGVLAAPWRAVVRVEGRALRLPAAHLKPLMDFNKAFAAILQRYLAACHFETSQLAACSSRHSISQRLARWLLRYGDRLETKTITCTHDYLSQALGVRRAGVTVSLGQFECAGIIKQSRGSIEVIDAQKLAAESCECRNFARLNFARLLG